MTKSQKNANNTLSAWIARCHAAETELARWQLLERSGQDAHRSIVDEKNDEIERLRESQKMGFELAIQRLQALEAAHAKNKRMREALEWYGEQARLSSMIAGRKLLEKDAGERARAALTEDNE